VLPHPDTVRKITALRYKERLRDAVQQRRAAGPKPRSCSWPTPSWSTQPTVISHLIGVVMCVRRAARVHLTSSLARGSSNWVRTHDRRPGWVPRARPKGGS
jgi:hypothetical protein